MLRPRRSGRRPAIAVEDSKMPKGLLKIMLMGSIGLFLGAAVAGYVFSM